MSGYIERPEIKDRQVFIVSKKYASWGFLDKPYVIRVRDAMSKGSSEWLTVTGKITTYSLSGNRKANFDTPEEAEAWAHEIVASRYPGVPVTNPYRDREEHQRVIRAQDAFAVDWKAEHKAHRDPCRCRVDTNDEHGEVYYDTFYCPIHDEEYY